MRAGLGVALVGLVVCVGCGREPDAVSPKPPPPKSPQEKAIAAIEPEAVSPEPPPPKSPQEKAIAAIEAMKKGSVKIDKNGVVVEVYLSKTEVTGAGLVHLKGLTGLETLSLFLTKVTDAGLVHLKGLNKLETLFLSGTKVTDAGLEHLKVLTKLDWLQFNNTKITDAGVKKLKQALPNCDISH